MPTIGSVETDDSGEPIRAGRGGSPGGFTGGGGGGGIAGLSGGGGFSLGAPGGWGANNPSMLRRRYFTMADQTRPGNGGSVSTSPVGYAGGGPVAPQDTVPAMLEPGEFVVRRDAAQQPQNAAMLEAMNGGQMGMAPPMLSREALVELLSVLLAGPGMSHRGMGSGVEMGDEDGFSKGGWVKWALPALALAAPFAAPAIAGALGGGAAAGAGAAGAGAAGAGAAGAAGAGLSTVAVPATQHFGLGALMAAHPGLGSAYVTALRAKPLFEAGMATKGVMDEQHDARMQQQAQDEQESNAAIERFRAIRGYAAGGSVSPNWQSRLQGGWRPGWAGTPAVQSPGAPTSGGGGSSGGIGPADIGSWLKWSTDPNALNAMQEGATRDANAYASSVGREAVLADADPGAQAAYRLRALASAGRGASERLSEYRSKLALQQQQQFADLEKQRLAAAYEERLKRIH